MNMESRRFGAGLVAGILVGVAVVALAGGLGSTLSTLSLTFAAPRITETTTAATATTTSGTSVLYVVTAGTSSQSKSAASNYTNLSSSSSSFSFTGVSGGLSSLLPSSQLAAVATQGPVANAILSVPVIIALALGGLLYRVASKRSPVAKDDD